MVVDAAFILNITEKCFSHLLAFDSAVRLTGTEAGHRITSKLLTQFITYI